jgi:hypothetical protein
MNKRKKILLTLGTLALFLGISGAITNTASAYRGDPAVKGPNYSAERHLAMEKAFATNDYSAWKNLMPPQSRVQQVINKDNFAKFAEAHKLALSDNTAEAQKIRQELGLGLKDGSGQKMKKGFGNRINNINR